MTYLEMAQHLCEKHSDYWDYYRIHRRQPFFEHFQEPRLFIHSTFEHAQKHGLINKDSTGQPEISEARAAHSISAFFFGFLLAKNLDDGRALRFYTKRPDDVDTSSGFSFSYMWTLLCLYHDYGYYLENNHNRAQHLIREIYRLDMRRSESETDFCQMVSQKPIKAFCRKMHIRRHIWITGVSMKNQSSQNRMQTPTRDNTTIYIADQIIQAYMDRPKMLFLQGEERAIVFPTRSKEEIGRYFGYRLFPAESEKACIDHGIAGGLLFFDRLIKNYETVYSNSIESLI